MNDWNRSRTGEYAALKFGYVLSYFRNSPSFINFVTQYEIELESRYIMLKVMFWDFNHKNSTFENFF